MSEIPSGWTLAQLGALLRAPLRNGHSAKESTDPKGVRILTLTAVTLGDFSVQNTKVTSADPTRVAGLWLEPGDLLIERSNTPELVGTTRLYKGPRNFAVFPDLVIRVQLSEQIIPRFAELVLQSRELRHYFQKRAKGMAGSMPKIDQQTISEAPIPLPPLAEQKRIVAKIEELFSELEAGEESLRVARRQLGVYRQSLLKQAFEGKLTEKWRTQNPAKLESPATLPEAEGPHVPLAGWRWIKLGTAIDEPAYGTSKKCSYESSGLGVLRIPNVVNGAIEADDLKFAEFTEDERKSYELRSGDLLLIRSNGSVSIVGRCAIVEPKHTGFLYAGYLIRLRPRNTLLDSRFLLSQFASHRLRSQIEFSAKSTSGVNNINSKEIQRLVIALPSLPEQQEIVRLLDEQFEVIERNERELDAALKRSEALRQAILKKAFTGRLVPQDPSDEPAQDLLARLRMDQRAGVAAKGQRQPVVTK